MSAVYRWTLIDYRTLQAVADDSSGAQRPFQIVGNDANLWSAFEYDCAFEYDATWLNGARIGDFYDNVLWAMSACARTAGHGDGLHLWESSIFYNATWAPIVLMDMDWRIVGRPGETARELLVAQARELVIAAGGPECTYDALSDSDIAAMIAQLRIERNAA